MTGWTKSFPINSRQHVTVTIDEHSNIVLHFFGCDSETDRTYHIQNGAVREFLDIFRMYFKIRRMERSPTKLARNFLTDLNRAVGHKRSNLQTVLSTGGIMIILNAVELLPTGERKTELVTRLNRMIPPQQQ
ncbi:hypothetical protein HN858_04590 [Candidatus Falkowbacteria bacterium]|jgi:hypothetical protein|nr:hypothetical protein [Candidatus Falkowbacteria bacterium]MBT5503862.1 hypothetical protein [Candidatus Falkowbacteria bacterium]MBT6574405.1 hypothetical protein [Candidatus Falkowbacteria bacterium]MBT7348922.1 hypothetical protein [Candidatus Falkowbacteria bacterium]MBT7501278.1 hypothetical protein [Candidatus Falkowbacteria bacterium]